MAYKYRVEKIVVDGELEDAVVSHLQRELDTHAREGLRLISCVPVSFRSILVVWEQVIGAEKPLTTASPAAMMDGNNGNDKPAKRYQSPEPAKPPARVAVAAARAVAPTPDELEYGMDEDEPF